MFERFTDRARRVVVLAQEEARLLGHDYIGTEHLLLGLVKEGGGMGSLALEALGVDLQRIRHEISEIVGPGPGAPKAHIPFTPRAKSALEASFRESLKLGHGYIGTEHVLLGLVQDRDGVAAQVLSAQGIGADDVRRKLTELLHATAGGTGGASSPVGTPDMTQALALALALARSRAGAGPAGTHHLLAVLAENETMVAHRILAAGGFSLDAVDPAPEEWDPSGTLDEAAPEAT